MDGFIVEKDSVGFLSMRAQAFAVIGGDHDQRIVIQLAGSQGSNKISDCCICRGYRGIVGSAGRSLGVIQVHPQKEWPLAVAAKPGVGPSDDLRSRPIRSELLLARTALRRSETRHHKP